MANSTLLASAKLLRSNVHLLQRGDGVDLIDSARVHEGCITHMNGICDNIRNILQYVYHKKDFLKEESKLNYVMRTWAAFSGSIHYPVPHPDHSPADGYEIACEEQQLWTGEYGSCRIQLLDFIIEVLTYEEALH